MFPEAYLTATRQEIAINHKWSLEDLKLEFSINGNDDDQDTFVIK